MTYALRVAYSATLLPTRSELAAMALSVLWVLGFSYMAVYPPVGMNAQTLQITPWLGVMLLAWQWYGVLWKDSALDWVMLRHASLVLALAASLNASIMLVTFA